MNDLIDLLHNYCEKFTNLEEELLTMVERETNIKTLSPRMLSGKLQGSFLALLSNIKKPEFILEIGTFTGYSALCLAQGLAENGKLFTIDYDEESSVLAQHFFNLSTYSHKINMIVGDAKTVIPTLPYFYDLVFIDADKEAYSLYFDLVIERCNPGALIIADNVLWSGKVLEDTKSRKTQAIHSFNIKVWEDPRVDCTILPLRDGITLMRVK
jgi:caffeoyl-CoA O-methyltransferase